VSSVANSSAPRIQTMHEIDFTLCNFANRSASLIRRMYETCPRP
jgi:hypothetical protein